MPMTALAIHDNNNHSADASLLAKMFAIKIEIEIDQLN